jgi:translation initiation factor 2 subunit 3
MSDIKEFLKGTIAENAPVIPMSAIHGINLDLLISAIQKFIPTPKRDEDAPLRLFAARSFDINRPGTIAMELKGGVFGGSIKSGKVKVGDQVVILPGLKKRIGKKTERIPIKTNVVSIRVGSEGHSEVATPGGLVAVQTTIDPSMTRSDNLSGSIITSIGNEPDVVDELEVQYTLFESVVGSNENEKVKPLVKNEPLLLTIGTETTTGVITDLSKNRINLKLTGVVALDPTVKIALSRNINKRWRLIGYGEVASE